MRNTTNAIIDHRLLVAACVWQSYRHLHRHHRPFAFAAAFVGDGVGCDGVIVDYVVVYVIDAQLI